MSERKKKPVDRGKVEAARDSAMLQMLFYRELSGAAARQRNDRDWRVFDAAADHAAKEALRLARRLNGGKVPL